MTDVEKLHLIESYHCDMLSPTERQTVEALIENDPEFAQELKDYEFLLDGFGALELEHFEAQLQSWEKKHQEKAMETPVIAMPQTVAAKTEGKMFSMRRLYAVAAVVAFCLFLPIGYNYLSSPDGLSAEFLAVSNAPSGVRGGGDTLKSTAELMQKKQLKDRAFDAFNTKKYAESIPLLEQYINTYGAEHEALFFLGAAKLNNNDAANATRDLDQAFDHIKGAYSPEAQWLLGVAQFQLKNNDACKRILNNILAQPYHDFKDRAEKLLKKL